MLHSSAVILDKTSAVNGFHFTYSLAKFTKYALQRTKSRRRPRDLFFLFICEGHDNMIRY